jgi:hypothetical protein
MGPSLIVLVLLRASGCCCCGCCNGCAMSGAIQCVGEGRSLSEPVDGFRDGILTFTIGGEDTTGTLASRAANDGRRPGLGPAGPACRQLGEFNTGLALGGYLLIPLTEALRLVRCIGLMGPFVVTGFVGYRRMGVMGAFLYRS